MRLALSLGFSVKFRSARTRSARLERGTVEKGYGREARRVSGLVRGEVPHDRQGREDF